jgi:hypothetical protein
MIGAPCYHKLDFPKFEGKEDPLTWLNCCEQFFWGQRTDEAFKVWLAAYHMVCVAQDWYMQPTLWATNPKQSSRRDCKDAAI